VITAAGTVPPDQGPGSPPKSPGRIEQSQLGSGGLNLITIVRANRGLSTETAVVRFAQGVEVVQQLEMRRSLALPPPAARNLENRQRSRSLLCASCPEVGRALRPDLLAK
jgi:hypothetical protein